MPKTRLPRELWQQKRIEVWQRDGGRCQGPYCRGEPPLPLNRCHVDHKQSGKRAGNRLAELRILCRRCHCLRADLRHRGLLAAALRDGLIPADWRRFAWDDTHWPSEETIQALRSWISQQEHRDADHLPDRAGRDR